MTEPEALPGEDLWPPDGDPSLWDEDDSWAGHPMSRSAVKSPWYRSPGLLLALIGLAAATLVVAAVLLVTGEPSGETPARLRPDTGTTPALSSPPERPSVTPPAPSTSDSASSSTAEPDEPAEPLPPVEPAPVEQPAPSASVAPEPPIDPVEPRVSLTRTPMSFSPGGKGS